MKNIFTTAFLICSFAMVSFAQTPTVQIASATNTPAQMVQNVLAGPGVQITNVKFNDNLNYVGNQIGTFSYGGTQIPFASGIVIGSGGVSNNAGTGNGMIGPNGSGSYSMNPSPASPGTDAQLAPYAPAPSIFNPNPLNDVGRLEFDFIPVGNKVKFDFIFGSEEYNEFVCSSFYDVFGFFVTGPNPAGGNYTNTNLALVPNTTLPISINTLNNGISAGGSSCPAGGLANAQYFAGAPGAHFQMDGVTKKLTIEFNVECGQQYHFKFAIADVSDAAYDSWVFLKAGSFSSEAVQVSVATVSGDNTVIEGCTQADIIFTRPVEQSDTAMTIIYELGGSAVEGTDYQNLPNPIQFQPGQDSLIISLIPILDGNSEGLDSVIITTKIVNQCGDTIVSSGTIYIIDEPNIIINHNDPTVYCANDSIQIWASASGASKPPFTYTWSTGATTDSTYVSTGLNGPFEYTVTIKDACGFTKTDTVHINLLQTLKIDTLIMSPSEGCLNTGIVNATVQGVSGTPVYTWMTTDSTVISNQLTVTDLGPGWYIFTVQDNICSITDSILVEAINAPIASIVADKTNGCNPTTFTLSNQSQNANTYKWNTGSGYVSTSSSGAQTVTMTSTGKVYLIASNGTCADTTEITLNIVNCGCTDNTAINFDANAQQDDGSCIYHGPEVVTPNVFTPNGDGKNDTYQFITVGYVSGLEYWIFNRWGNVMYHFEKDNNGVEMNPQTDVQYWDGKVKGQTASEGVYFLKYVAKGLNDEKIEGQTFFHLNR